MVDKLKKEVKRFLEGKPSPVGEKLWYRWFELPNYPKTDEKAILSSSSDLKKEIRYIKRISFRLLGLNYNQWQMAASLVVFIGVSGWFYFSSTASMLLYPITYSESITQPGQRIKVSMSDGTQVWINAGSVLKYPKIFQGDTREVYLEGEAFFDVAKDKEHPFIIHTSKMDTKVVGTSFNVQAYPDKENEEVSVLTGKVSVSSVETDQQIFITPGQKASLDKKSNAIKSYSKIDISSISTWRTNTLFFDNAPINEVISAIERNYGIRIEMKDLKFKPLNINAGFEKLSAEQVIMLLCNTIDASYAKESGVYIIKSNELNKKETK
ncbi:FecR family protein [Flavobacterium sp.]|uniref:FecR family protein n=1 Tax=Flavobacterium sp. TaxID=239 RepID=UPI003C5DEB5A